MSPANLLQIAGLNPLLELSLNLLQRRLQLRSRSHGRDSVDGYKGRDTDEGPQSIPQGFREDTVFA